jgi:hypothetical protein
MSGLHRQRLSACFLPNYRCPTAAHMLPGSAAGSYSSSSGSSRPDSPGTPSAQPPPLQRRLSMQRTASIRRLDSLADMCVG